MYNIIEKGTNRVLASFNGAMYISAADWCERYGYKVVGSVNSRNWFVARSI